MMDDSQATLLTAAWRRRRRARLCAARWAFRHALFLKSELKHSLYDTLPADMLKVPEALTVSGFAKPPEVTDGETTLDNSTMNDSVAPVELGDPAALLPAASAKNIGSDVVGCENSSACAKLIIKL